MEQPLCRKRPSASSQLVLLLDHREIGAGRDHAARGALLADLASKLGAASVEGRSLPLGDMLWIWRDSYGEEPVELVAGWVVERKTFHDLSASIVDGRYDEQKMRLLEAPGLDAVVYLVEGPGPLFGVAPEEKAGGNSRAFGQRLLQRSLPASTLSTSVVHTQLISGFHVLQATSTPHSLALLVALHGALQARGPIYTDSAGEPATLVPYAEFAERTRKSCHSRAFEVFGRMLRMVPNCGPEATEVLLDEFQTPHALATALRDHSDSELMQRLRARRIRVPITAAVLASCRSLFAP